MRRILCVHLKQWEIDCVRRRSRQGLGGRERRVQGSGFRVQSLVLVETVASRQLVVVASPQAIERGVKRGMTLAEARALCPGLSHLPHEPEKDRRAIEALARWMVRFSPVATVCGTGASPVLLQSLHGRGARATTDWLPGILLDITGCERLYGGLPNLVEQVREAMAAFGFASRVAVAPGVGAAWALASAGSRDGIIVGEAGLRQALAPLPPASLRIGDEAAAALYHLGIDTVGQLLELPRHALPSRFGDTLLRRIDHALARVPEPIQGVAHESPVESGLEFGGAVDSLEILWLAFKELIGRMTADLRRRGSGARHIEARFERAHGPPLAKTILLSAPSRDPVNLFNLVRCAMETLGEAGTKRGKLLTRVCTEEGYVAAGFTAVSLHVRVMEKVQERQTALLEQEEQDGREALGRLVERLCLRLGEESVLRAQLVESHVPEKACRVQGSGFRVQESGHAVSVRGTRPLHLLLRPVEVKVMVSPSEDREGRPVSITLGDEVRRVVHALGPERIAGRWWEGHDKTRDYFTVEDDRGRRSWVFRVAETRKWYLHGEYA